MTHNESVLVFYTLAEFTKEYIKLCKKYPSLEKDFAIFKSALAINPFCHIRIEGLGNSITGIFFKVKKFRCQSIAKNSVQSGIRIVYRYIEPVKTIEFCEIEFVEIYHKNCKSDIDRERIKRFYSKI